MVTIPVPEVAAAPGFLVPEPFAIRRVTREAQDTFTLTVAPQGGGDTSFVPGQFSMLWSYGVGEVPISISGDPAEHDCLRYTIRSVGAATQALVGRRAGETIGVRGPFGHGWPLAEARGRDVLIVAGGIGLAPLRGVIYHVLRNRRDYGRLILLYGSRSPKDLLYRKEFAAWARLPDTQALVTVDYGGLNWHGRVGVVTTLFKYARLHPERTTAMVCGPEIMMRFVIRELRGGGFAREDIHLSLERNMRCGSGFCGHCQWGPWFICKDGPVFRYDRIRPLVDRHEL